MQIETTRWPLKPTRRAKIKTTATTNFLVTLPELPKVASVNIKWENNFGKPFGISYQFKHAATFESSSYAPGCFPKRNENICPQKAFSRMFIVDLFIIANNWKQPKCQSMG